MFEKHPPADASRSARRALQTLALLAVALAWASLGGAGHFFHANADWVVRDAVLRDLVVGDWPVRYAAADGAGEVLRAPIAYYLPAALLGKFVGLPLADRLLFAWTALGVWLLLLIVMEPDDSPRVVAGKVAVVVLFSGMDIAGAVITAEPISFTSHLEWWAGLFQYSSHTTQLFWVPGHALPGWIAAALLYRGWHSLRLVRLLPAIVASIPLWSPLTALGVAPLAAAAFLERVRREGWRGAIPPHAWTGALVLAALLGAFITADVAGTAPGDAQRIRSGWIWSIEQDMPSLFARYVLFLVLEYLVLVQLLLTVHRPTAVVVSGAVLALLPIYLFGPGNDFVMRASIAPLMVIALALGDAIPRLLGREVPSGIRAMAVAVLLVGCATPITEIARAVARPVWKPDASRSVVDVKAGGHYLAGEAGGHLVMLLRGGGRPIKATPVE